YFPITGLAGSQQGLIPFTPNTVPSQYHGTLPGHVYVSATFDTTALTKVPSEIDGNLVLNIDPNRTGQAFGGLTVDGDAFATRDLVDMLLNPKTYVAVGNELGSLAHQLFTNISVGV